MSGIGSVSGTSNIYSTSSAENAAVGQRISNRAEKMEAQLDQDLAAAGVSVEVREALESRLSEAFEQQFASGSAQDPQTMQDTVASIFEEYGLDAEEFRPQGPPPGGGPRRGGGPPPGGGAPPSDATEDVSLLELLEDLESTETDETSLTTSLLETLGTQVQNEDLGADTAATLLSQHVLDTLFGFDAEA